MSHGSYDSNLSSQILILGGDIRSRSWPNMDGTYCNTGPVEPYFKQIINFQTNYGNSKTMMMLRIMILLVD